MSQNFLNLWQQLERTRQLLAAQRRRFCLRSLIKTWIHLGIINLDTIPKQPPDKDSPDETSIVNRKSLNRQSVDDLIWQICLLASRTGHEVYGMNELPPPSTHPRIHREILIALLMVLHGLGKHSIDTRALDEAYHQAFPHSTPLNISKKKRLNKVAPPPS